MDIPFDVASNPEFLKEGAAIQDFMKPDRIVVGVDSERAQELMSKLYNPFTLNGHPVLFMDIPSAEMTKYAANSMLATKISFMNDIANLCRADGGRCQYGPKGNWLGSADRQQIHLSRYRLWRAPAFKSVKALIRTGREQGYQMRILESVEEVNELQKEVLFDKIHAHFDGDLEGKTFSMWGLSFKPNTDDMREAPALVLIEKLLNAGAKVRAYDPVAMEEAKHSLGDSIHYAKDEYDALVDSHGLLLVTEWSEFRVPNWDVVKKLMSEKVVFDGRNIYDRADIEALSFRYHGIGV